MGIIVFDEHGSPYWNPKKKKKKKKEERREKKTLEDPEKRVETVVDCGVRWVIYGRLSSIHSPTLGPGQQLKKRRGASLGQRVGAVCTEGIRSPHNSLHTPSTTQP